LCAGLASAQPPGITPEMINTTLPEEGAPKAEPGPYAVTSEAAFGAPGLMVFHPTDLEAFPKRDTLPVVVWGNGGCAIDSTRYSGFLSTIASHGFLVLGTAKTDQARRQATADDLRGAIDWADKERRHDWVMRGFRQFDAPVSIVVTFDRDLENNDIAIFDCGAIVNCLVNAAWSKGLGCVINGQGIMQSPVVREHARIPEDQVIMSCVAMGYPADDFPANAVVSRRRAVDEVVRFVGFDED
jgi:nitroreductase